jgi:hypothetical protein
MTNPTESETTEKKSAQKVIGLARNEREWRKYSNDRLRQTMRDQEKMALRTEYLEQNPDKRIRIDTSLLKDVVKYDIFKCHPDCSVGRDESIVGSDIDGGIVVTKEPVSPEAQQEFVDRLRLMGFSCYSQAELDGFDSVDDTTIEDSEKRDVLMRLRIDSQNELISFVTTEQVESAISSTKLNPRRYDSTGVLPALGLDILVVGHEIESLPPELALAA